MTVNRTALHGIILWILAIAAIIGGYHLAIENFLDQDWLSRAGCFIVVLGIWSGLGGLIERKLQHRRLRMKKYLAMRRLRRAFRADKEQLDKEAQKLHQQYTERFEALKDDLGISVGFVEASLLITGTLLWGFGDLVRYL